MSNKTLKHTVLALVLFLGCQQSHTQREGLQDCLVCEGQVQSAVRLSYFHMYTFPVYLTSTLYTQSVYVHTHLVKVGGIVPAETGTSVGTSGCFQSLLALSESPTGLPIMTYDR